MRISAVIFDLNGTVLDDEELYAKAFGGVLKSLGVEPPSGIFQQKGIGVKENWEIFLKRYPINTDKNSSMLTEETQNAYLKTISEISVRAGFSEFVERLKESGILIGLATSNTWEITDRVLTAADLQGVFDVISTREEILYSKPDPDIFTLTADKLGCERENCLVIEDSASGVEAARRAGMKVVGITVGENDSDLLKNADAVVEGFSEITPQLIDQL